MIYWLERELNLWMYLFVMQYTVFYKLVLKPNNFQTIFVITHKYLDIDSQFRFKRI